MINYIIGIILLYLVLIIFSTIFYKLFYLNDLNEPIIKPIKIFSVIYALFFILWDLTVLF